MLFLSGFLCQVQMLKGEGIKYQCILVPISSPTGAKACLLHITFNILHAEDAANNTNDNKLTPKRSQNFSLQKR